MSAHRQGVTDEDLELVDAVARFAASTLAPRAAALDESEASCLEHVPALGAMGLMGLNLPVELGGPGATPAGTLLALAEISKHCAATSSMIGAHYLGTDAVYLGGDEAQQRRYLPRLLSGEDFWCQLFSEPGAGSDLANLGTRAVRDGDEFVVNGQKIWTSGAQYAKYGILIARTDADAPKHKGISYFICPMDLPGIEIRPIVEMTGGTTFNEVFFTDVRLPAENLVGDLHDGWRLEIGRAHV